MAKQFWDYATSYKIFLVRALFYSLMPCIMSFLAIAQTVDLDTKYPSMGVFERSAFWLGIAVPGMTAFVALLDRSREIAKKSFDGKQSGMTELFTKDTGP